MAGWQLALVAIIASSFAATTNADRRLSFIRSLGPKARSSVSTNGWRWSQH